MDCWRSNAPRMRTATSVLYISGPGQRADLGTEIYRMSKAVLVRGAFAIQCNSPAPPVWLTVTACSHACSDYHSPIGMTGTVQTSDLAKWRQDDVCCRRTIRHWKAETLTFPAMYGTAAAEQKKFTHTSRESECTVQYRTRLSSRVGS